MDFNGRVMSLPINPDNIEAILENGIGFDGSSIAGYGIVESSDRLLYPDRFKILKFQDETVGFFVASIFNEQDHPADSDPRSIHEKCFKESRARVWFYLSFRPGT